MTNFSSSAANSHGDKPLTVLEEALQAIHGDLHEVIPRLAANRTYGEVAEALRLDSGAPSESWVRAWLRNNGYVRKFCFVREDQS